MLDAAFELFARDGYAAAGVDTIAERSGVAKMTLYRHFASKDALIAAVLERGSASFWDWYEREIAPIADPCAQILALVDGIQRQATSPACLGCMFQGAAAEFPRADHPGHAVALAYKRAIIERLTELAAAAGASDPTELAESLAMLIDGAWASARMFGPGGPARALRPAAVALLDAALTNDAAARRGRRERPDRR